MKRRRAAEFEEAVRTADAAKPRERTPRERLEEWEKWHGLHWRLLRGESTDVDIEDLERSFGPEPFKSKALQEYVEILTRHPAASAAPRAAPPCLTHIDDLGLTPLD